MGQKNPAGPPGKGRSLADLAARVPEASHPARTQSTGTGRFPSRSDSGLPPDTKVIRFTREKLLALRPTPATPDDVPESLLPLSNLPIVSSQALDPGKSNREVPVALESKAAVW